MPRRWVVGVLLAVLLGLGLRLGALRGEFWLDEILSHGHAREAGSPWGVFGVKEDILRARENGRVDG